MNAEKKSSKVILMGIIGAVLLMLLAGFVVEKAEESRSELPVYKGVPDFTFTECRGDSFGSGDMKGNICVVDFIFTRCQSICPRMADKYTHLYELYEDYPDVKLVSISVDPVYDTPEVLWNYALSFDVTDDRWVLLNGPLDEVINLCENGFMLPADNLPMGHSAKFVLVDRGGKIRGYYNSQDWDSVEILKTHIRQLYKVSS